MSERKRKILMVAILYGVCPMMTGMEYIFAPLTSSPSPGVERAALAHVFLPLWLGFSLLITSAVASCALGVWLRAVSGWAGGAALVVSAGVVASCLWRLWTLWPSDYLMFIAIGVIGGLTAALVVPILAWVARKSGMVKMRRDFRASRDTKNL